MENELIHHKFKHTKKEFGILGNPTRENVRLFQQKIYDHVEADDLILGTYRNRPVYHYLDRSTKVNVMLDTERGKFLSV